MDLNYDTKVPGINRVMWRLIWNWMQLYRRNHPESGAPFSLETTILMAIVAHEDGSPIDREET